MGSGFLAFNNHVLTCAHVVADALYEAHNIDDCCGRFVELDFPLLVGVNQEEKQQKIKAEVIFWKPISPGGNWVGGDDIAGLKLEENFAEEIVPTGLILGNYAWNRFKVLGFPVGYDNGVWTQGELRGVIGNGQVQMVVTEQSDYRVEGGFSGAPVWIDTLNGVGGIVVAAEDSDSEKRKYVKAAFMIPGEVFRESSWDDLKPHIIDAESNYQSVSENGFNNLKINQQAQPSINQTLAKLLDISENKQSFTMTTFQTAIANLQR